ncbi:hypothetical protein KJ969_04840 [Patescibacteria group bacterium]|nr:hypothetical protein [Patescibacteria group bacterium]MBU1922000.1 hypothetical protein [Patescibacteria group bacterium]
MECLIEKNDTFDYWSYAKSDKENQEYFNYLLKLGAKRGNVGKYFYQSTFFFSSPEFIFNLILRAKDPEIRNMALAYLKEYAEPIVFWTLKQINTPHDEASSRNLLQLFLLVLRSIMGDISGRIRETLEALSEHTPKMLHDLIAEQTKYLNIRYGHQKKYGYLTKHITENIVHALYFTEKTSHP